MTTLCSYDLNGKKLSFANWISNLSPQETPFTSMTSKESINQTMFQWQTDFLFRPSENAVFEGSEATDTRLESTTVLKNYSQILRKVVKVSDTANNLANYGRGRELQYQMEKAGKEIKRDLEWAFLNNLSSQEGDDSTPRLTAGVQGLVSSRNAADPNTGAVTHMDYMAPSGPTEQELFRWTYNLYLAGSTADIIMFHPDMAGNFSSLQEKGSGERVRIFESTPKFSVQVSTITDPLGQVYKLIPNRWMPKGFFYCFNTADFTQMVLRPPQRVKLSKEGSYEKWMIEAEVGLRLRHPYAAGILRHKSTRKARSLLDDANLYFNSFNWEGNTSLVKVAVGGGLMIGYTIVGALTRIDETANIEVYKGGQRIYVRNNIALGTSDFIEIFDGTNTKAAVEDSGKYVIYVYTDSYEAYYEFTLEVSGRDGIIIPVGDLIKTATCDGQDIMKSSVRVDTTIGASAEDVLVITSTEYGKDAKVFLYKNNTTTGVSELINEGYFTDGSYSFGIAKMAQEYAGKYRVIVQKDRVAESTQFVIVNVEDPMDTSEVVTMLRSGDVPIPPDGVINVKEGSQLILKYRLSAKGQDSTVKFIEASTFRPLIQSQGKFGDNIFSYTVKQSDQNSSFIIEADTHSGKYYSDMFKLKVTSDAPIPEVSTIFWEENSYVGAVIISNAGEKIIDVDPGTFNDEYISIYQHATGADAEYYVVNKATGVPYKADVSDKVAVGTEGDFYVYLSGTPFTESDSGQYFIKAIKNGKQQVSAPFTILLQN